jgi:hypothetical protein
MKASFSANLSKFSFLLDEVALISRDGDTAFKTVYTVKLGSGEIARPMRYYIPGRMNLSQSQGPTNPRPPKVAEAPKSTTLANTFSALADNADEYSYVSYNTPHGLPSL